MLYIVSYDLKDADSQDYTRLLNYIKKMPFKQIGESTYCFESKLGAKAIIKEIADLIEARDKVYFITNATDNTVGVWQIFKDGTFKFIKLEKPENN